SGYSHSQPNSSRSVSRIPLYSKSDSLSASNAAMQPFSLQDSAPINIIYFPFFIITSDSLNSLNRSSYFSICGKVCLINLDRSSIDAMCCVYLNDCWDKERPI